MGVFYQVDDLFIGCMARDGPAAYGHTGKSFKKTQILIEQRRREYNKIQSESARDYCPPVPEAILNVIAT